MAAVDPASTALSIFFDRGILGVTVVVLALVIRFMFKYYTTENASLRAEIKDLNAARLMDSITHAADYREMAKNDQAVLSGNSQANALLSAKIQAGKGE